MNFKTSSLASLSSLITKGTTPTTLGYAHSDSGIPFLRVQNIFSGQVNFKEDTLFIDSNTHTALKRSQIQGGDVLVTIAGTIGRTGVVPHDAPEMNCNQAVAIVRPTPEIERSYLRHWLESQEARSQMLGSTVTGTISNLSLSQLGELRVPLPPLEEQRRIAAILDQAETLRIQRRTALALLDSLTQSLFLDMFGDPVANPKGFQRQKLGDLISTGPQNGLYKSSTEYGSGTPILRIDAFYDGVVTKLNSLKRVRLSPDEVTTFGLAAEDIVINRVNSIEYLGKSALIPTLSEPTVFESNMMRFTVRRELLDPGYVVHFLQTPFIKSQILAGSKNAVNQSSINQQDVKGFQINVPPLPLQQTFATRIASIEALKATHRRALAALDALFASLQQRAFLGELTSTPAVQTAITHAPAQNFQELLQLEAAIALEALIYVAHRMPDGDLYKTHKALYFADRHHLEVRGRLIYNETYCALPHGPVPQAAYDATRVLSGERLFSDLDNEALRAALRRSGNTLETTRDADVSKLSPEALESLEWAIRYCRDMSFAQTKAASHDSAYERTPKNEAIPLQYIIDTLPPEARQRHWNL